MRKKKGFTLIELLIVIGIIAILMAIAIVAINPGRQFAKANNARRFADVNTILNAVSQNIVDGKGTFISGGCEAPIPATFTKIAFDATPENPNTDTTYDICGCLVATYIGAMPVDPSATGATYTSCAAYDTGYEISQAATGRVTVRAPAAQSENGGAPTISVTR